MHKLKRKILKYPIVFLFFIFLMGFFIFDGLLPSKEVSELENRPLSQFPDITFDTLANNTWMVNYESYVKDQFAFRDSWINVKSITENVLLKTENNDILYGDDNYLFAKNWGINDLKRYNNNVSALVRMSENLKGNASIMIVPSSSNILSEKLPVGAPMIDENAYLDDIFNQVENAGANVIDIRDVLNENEQDYIYYRTDHHWTINGAFLAYEYYANLHNLNVFDKDKYDKINVEDFLGTHYSKARNVNVVADTLSYYDIDNNLSVLSIDSQGNKTYENGSIYDELMFDERDKYAAFLRGNNGYSVIDGDGEGKILVVKDSYANSFIPFLTASYEQIGIVDFRENRDTLYTIMEQENYEDVLFLYSFDAFSQDIYVGSKIVGTS